MTESGFTQSIMRKFDKRIYKWKIMNTMQKGVPDCYFSGPAGDLWLEVKYITAPKRETTLIKTGLSALQLKWLTGRHKEGRNVALLIGSDIGSQIRTQFFELPAIRTSLVLTKQQVIEWIETPAGRVIASLTCTLVAIPGPLLCKVTT